MPSHLIEFARVFAQGRMEPDVFAEAFGWLYKIATRTDDVSALDPNTCEAVAILAGLAEVYNPAADRLPCELSGAELLEKVVRTLDLYEQNLLGDFSWAMTSSFAGFPNKRPAPAGNDLPDIWPELGPEFMLNKFYRLYDGSEGWIGKSYLAMWSRQEIQEFRAANREAYPACYHFFASNGGGTQFGFCQRDGVVSFVSAPNIGDEEDIRFLGDCEHFLQAVASADYI